MILRASGFQTVFNLQQSTQIQNLFPSISLRFRKGKQHVTAGELRSIISELNRTDFEIHFMQKIRGSLVLSSYLYKISILFIKTFGLDFM